MNCLFKLFLLLFAFAVAMVFLVVGGVWLIGNYAPSQMEKLIEQRTDFDLDLGRTRLSPVQGVVEVSNARLGNPPEFPSPDFLDVEHLRVGFDAQSLKTDELRFEEVTLVIRRLGYVVREDGRSNMAVFAERLAGEGAERKVSDGFSRRPYRIERVFIRLDELFVDAPQAEVEAEGLPRPRRSEINYRIEATDVTDLEGLLEPLMAQLREAGVDPLSLGFLDLIPFEGLPSILQGMGQSMDEAIEALFRRKAPERRQPRAIPAE